MIKYTLILIALIISVCWASYNVVGLSLYRSNGGTVADIITDGPTNIKTLSLVKPDRLIIDLHDGIHRLRTDDLPTLPPGIVMKFRSAQYQAKPTPITRIVLVLAEPAGDVSVENGPRGGKVIIPTEGYPDIDTWSIGREVPGAPAPASAGAPTITETSKPPESFVADTSTAVPESVMTVITLDDSSGSDMAFVRPIVKYEGREFRDPFIVAESHKEQKFGEEAVATLDGLSLVGIVKSEGIFLAVLQDRSGWGYIMGVGDTVVDGKVGEVTDTTVMFNIEEFGVTRPVTLELSNDAEKK